MLQKLGFVDVVENEYLDLLEITIKFLKDNLIGYHEFFARLADEFNNGWRDDPDLILENAPFRNILPNNWRNLYHICFQKISPEEMAKIGDRLRESNPKTALLRPVIEFVWDAIANEDNWQPFQDLLKTIERKE